MERTNKRGLGGRVDCVPQEFAKYYGDGAWSPEDPIVEEYHEQQVSCSVFWCVQLTIALFAREGDGCARELRSVGVSRRAEVAEDCNCRPGCPVLVFIAAAILDLLFVAYLHSEVPCIGSQSGFPFDQLLVEVQRRPADARRRADLAMVLHRRL